MRKISLFLSLFIFVSSLACHTAYSQMVGANVFLQSRYLEIGMLSNGSYGAPSPPSNYHPHNGGTAVTPGQPLAEVYDYGHDGWTVGSPAFAGDFTYPGLPVEGWELQIGGARDQAFATTGTYAAGSGGIGMTGVITGYSSMGGNKAAYWDGTALGGQVAIHMDTRVDTEASWVIINVQLRNLGATPLSNVYYLRTFDADLDQTWGGTFSTNNWITYQNDTLHRSLVTSRGIITPSFMGLSATDSRARVFIYSAWPLSISQDLSSIYAGTFPGSVYAQGAHMDGDNALGLVFNLGTIASGDSTTLSYAYVFNDSTGVDSVQTSQCGGPIVAGTAIPNVTTACTTTPISISLSGASAYSATAYQWQSSADSVTWGNISGATGNVYSFTGLAVTTYYRCKVYCTASGAAEFTPGVRITFTAACPCIGLTAGTASSDVSTACATTSITLSDAGYTASGVTLQWQSSADSITWSDIAGANTVPYTFTGLAATTYYRLVVTCISSGVSVMSPGVNVAFIAVCPCAGLTAGTVTTNVMTACATTSITLGDTAYTTTGATYQWQSSTDSATWSNMAGATTVPYTFTGLGATTYYRLVVTCTALGTSVMSAGKKITFTASCPCAGLSAGTATANTTLACPTTAIILNDAGYTSSGATYQWQSSTDSATWSDMAGATTVPYTFTGLGATTYYRLVVTCTASGVSVVSAGVKITFTSVCSCTPLSAGVVTSNVTTACPTTYVLLNNSGYTTSGTTVQWQASFDNITWADVPVTSVPYYFTGLGATTYYRLKVTCIVSGASVVSASKLIVYTATCGPSLNVGNTASVANRAEIYPNPVSDELIIKTEVGMYTSFVISNAIGQQMVSQDISGSTTKVAVKELPEGVYYITLKGKQGSEVQQFVKW